MNKSNLMKAAHRIAKQTVAIVGDYLIALKLALKTVWKNVKEENKMKGTEKQIAWAKEIIAANKEKIEMMAQDKKTIPFFWGTDTEAPEFDKQVALNFVDSMNDAADIISNRETKIGSLYADSIEWEFTPELDDDDIDINDLLGF